MTEEEKLGWDERINELGMNDIEQLMEISIDIIELSRRKAPPILIPISRVNSEQWLQELSGKNESTEWKREVVTPKPIFTLPTPTQEGEIFKIGEETFITVKTENNVLYWNKIDPPYSDAINL